MWDKFNSTEEKMDSTTMTFTFLLLLFVIASVVAIFAYNKYQNYLRKSVIILTKTNGISAIDVNQLLNMDHTDSVYKILYNVDSHMGVCESEDGYVFQLHTHVLIYRKALISYSFRTSVWKNKSNKISRRISVCTSTIRWLSQPSSELFS